MSEMDQRLLTLSVSQLVIGNLLGVLQESNKHGRVLDALGQLQDSGNDIAAAQLELIVRTVKSVNGEEAPLIQQGLADWEVLRYGAAAPMLISMLLSPMDGLDMERLKPVLDEWSQVGGAEGQFYEQALQMIVDGASLAEAAQQANRAFDF